MCREGEKKKGKKKEKEALADRLADYERNETTRR